MLDTAAVSAAPAAFGAAALFGAVGVLLGDAEIGSNWPAVVGQIVLGVGSVATAVIAMLSARDRLRFDAGRVAREAKIDRLEAKNADQAAKIDRLEADIAALVAKTDACHDERDDLRAEVARLTAWVGARDTAHPLPDHPAPGV